MLLNGPVVEGNDLSEHVEGPFGKGCYMILTPEPSFVKLFGVLRFGSVGGFGIGVGQGGLYRFFQSLLTSVNMGAKL